MQLAVGSLGFAVNACLLLTATAYCLLLTAYCYCLLLLFQRMDSRKRSASTAAMHPVPTAVTAWR